jgi:hypothetical protein
VTGKGDRGKGDSDLFEVPEIEIGADVRARRLRFDSVPEGDVQLHGDERSFSKTERESLPDEVEPGVEYRDVRVRWLAAAYLDVEEAPEVGRGAGRNRR